MNFYSQVVLKAILLLIMAIPILKTLDGERNGFLSLASRILTVVLVVVCMVLSADIVLWLVVQILQWPLALQSLGPLPQALELPLVQIPSIMKQAPSTVGYIAGHLEQVTL